MGKEVVALVRENMRREESYISTVDMWEKDEWKVGSLTFGLAEAWALKSQRAVIERKL